jgi:preprotein translocase subunit SecE
MKVAVIKQNQDGQDKFDVFKWLAVAVLFMGGIVANYHFANALTPMAVPLKMAGWIILVAAMLGIAALTTQGKATIAFMKEARIELRKVVWPTRQETVQTTMIVVVLVVAIAMFLWIVDTGLIFFIGWLTGQRG